MNKIAYFCKTLWSRIRTNDQLLEVKSTKQIKEKKKTFIQWYAMNFYLFDVIILKLSIPLIVIC